MDMAVEMVALGAAGAPLEDITLVVGGGGGEGGEELRRIQGEMEMLDLLLVIGEVRLSHEMVRTRFGARYRQTMRLQLQAHLWGCLRMTSLCRRLHRFLYYRGWTSGILSTCPS